VTVAESDTGWLWSVPSLRRAALLVECSREVELVRFSPDGGRIVIGTSDTANVLNAHTGQKIAGPLRHAQTEPIYDAEFSVDSKSIATVSANGDARLWRLEDSPTSFVRLGHDD
jgi:WD40 repeat protein